MNFTVTAAMISGEVTLDHFTSDLLASDEFQKLMPLVDMRLQDKTGEDAVDIEVVFKDGSKIGERGTYEPVTWVDIENKFDSCVKHTAQPSIGSVIFSKLQRLEIQESMIEIFQ